MFARKTCLFHIVENCGFPWRNSKHIDFDPIWSPSKGNLGRVGSKLELSWLNVEAKLAQVGWSRLAISPSWAAPSWAHGRLKMGMRESEPWTGGQRTGYGGDRRRVNLYWWDRGDTGSRGFGRMRAPSTCVAHTCYDQLDVDWPSSSEPNVVLQSCLLEWDLRVGS